MLAICKYNETKILIGMNTMHKTYRAIFIILLALQVMMISSCTGSSDDYYVTGTGFTTLNWDAPINNTDDTPLVDLAGYIIYYGPITQAMSHSVYVEDPNVNTLVVENLRLDTNYMFVMTAVNNNRVESHYSNIINKIITQ